VDVDGNQRLMPILLDIIQLVVLGQGTRPAISRRACRRKATSPTTWHPRRFSIWWSDISLPQTSSVRLSAASISWPDGAELPIVL
jgi:hypothetical protein